MFRLSQYMREVLHPTPLKPVRKPSCPVVIWNFIRRCNLTCKHCYTTSEDIDFPGELTTPEIYKVMNYLKSFKVPVLILSGGEPLLHPDVFDISFRAKEMGFYVALSSNGTLITKENIQQIAAINYQYVGVSLDSIGDTHDQFRQKKGSFSDSVKGISLCRDYDIKAGIRYTLTKDNVHDFPAMLKFMDDEDIDKFYLSHLNYGGGGNKNRESDTEFTMMRDVMDQFLSNVYSGNCKGLNEKL